MKFTESMILDKLKSIIANVQDLEATEQKEMSLISQLKALVNDLDADKGCDSSYTDDMFQDVQFDFDPSGKLTTIDKSEMKEEPTEKEDKKEDKKKVKEAVDTAPKMLRIGDTVNFKISEQRGKAKVTHIELTEKNKAYGQDIKEVEWNLVNSGNVVVDLDNGKWAYGSQISPDSDIHEDAGAAAGGMASAPYVNASIHSPASTDAIYGLWSVPAKGKKKKSKKFKTPMAVRKFLEDNENWHEMLDECED